ncbi:MAG: hypothetical protein HYX41_08130 [Bdellovibrio sp.]|nr:hypothetical protein [Bdellovibrio sp.]
MTQIQKACPKRTNKTKRILVFLCLISIFAPFGAFASSPVSIEQAQLNVVQK